MRRLAIVVAVAGLACGICIAGVTAAAAQTQFTPITPETSTVTSTVTNCMMKCNSAVALCQNNCVVPGATGLAGGVATATSSSTSCQLTCTTTQISCQSLCAQQSPSR